MKSVIIVFIGSGIGGVVRYLLSRCLDNILITNFPASTLIVNIIACLILGFVVGLADVKQLLSPSMRLFWAIGFCGGFSTFSTFSKESLQLIQNGYTGTNLLYIASSVIVCLVATHFGGLMAFRFF
jgi:fluoride exporter